MEVDFAEIIIYWTVERGLSFTGIFYPICKFDETIFKENNIRSIIIEISQTIEDKRISFAKAKFLILSADEIPENVEFEILDGAKCIAKAVHLPEQVLLKFKKEIFS